MEYGKIILGAGLYGLYAAKFCGGKGEQILVLEHDKEPFSRATYVNQARIHEGYHYCRSYSTATKSAGYFDRFNDDHGFCVVSDYQSIYGIASRYSWTNAQQFGKFCEAARIKCIRMDPDLYFKPGLCEGAFDTCEYAYDQAELKKYYMQALAEYPNVQIKYGARVESIVRAGGSYEIRLASEETFATKYLLNTTYASVNQIITMLQFDPFAIKYELCEIILCRVSDELQSLGITIMDGPFFSIMPFGKTGYHSLTSVAFTPHVVSYETLPTFDCQRKRDVECSPHRLGNCNLCPAHPETAWPYMSRLARKFLREGLDFQYVGSLFSIKPILRASEIDDSRPTVIKRFSENPTFISVLSGKINTIYDLDMVL